MVTLGDGFPELSLYTPRVGSWGKASPTVTPHPKHTPELRKHRRCSECGEPITHRLDLEESATRHAGCIPSGWLP